MQTSSTILFVDDEKSVTKYFKKALSHHFSILTADSVKDAITILDDKHQEIAVVITDQRMPKQLGIELLQYTQAHYPNIVRMLTTAFCDVENAVSAINNAEVFRYIPKPWDLDDLEETIHQAVNRFKSLNQSGTADLSKERLINEMKDDCQHWLMYATHAYGDVDVYKSGIEALVCRYNILTSKYFDTEKATVIKREIDSTIAEEFLNPSILNELNTQSAQGFGITSSNSKKH